MASTSKRRRVRKSAKEERTVKQRKTEQVELSLSDVTCPICLSVEVEPVTLPCQHEFCLPCFTDTIFKANKQCPLCRMRIGAWTRTATKECTLVNKNRWDDIRRIFPDEVRRRLSGEDDDISNEYVPPIPKVVSSPGAIRQEYEEQMRQLADELARENRAGEELARKIAEEERQALEEQRRLEENDEHLAWNIAHEDTSSQSLCLCPDDGVVIKKGFPVQSHGDESKDSIGPEQSYFIPICVAPKTPVTTTVLAPAARAPDCAQYLPNFRDKACFSKSQLAATSEAVTNEVTAEPPLEQTQIEDQQADEGVRQRQLEEDFKLAKKIHSQLLSQERRHRTREDYQLRSRTRVMELRRHAPRKLRWRRTK
ncbi:E3 ubiquitin-protein ligase rnf168-like [Ornithodoros turicata]|uniref:E3 ubiquitin-protein ligase rnf168-like n=1 Tax=Ornithodoros turicata TaxID=34597 RepID=UPI003139B74A